MFKYIHYSNNDSKNAKSSIQLLLPDIFVSSVLLLVAGRGAGGVHRWQEGALLGLVEGGGRYLPVERINPEI